MLKKFGFVMAILFHLLSGLFFIAKYFFGIALVLYIAFGILEAPNTIDIPNFEFMLFGVFSVSWFAHHFTELIAIVLSTYYDTENVLHIR